MKSRVYSACRLGLVITATATARAQTSAPLVRDTVPRVSMTVSGGVSLGSYQAGAAWAFVYVLRHRKEIVQMHDSLRRVIPDALIDPPSYQLDVLTGASAGNVNAVIGAIEYCEAQAGDKPEQSLFWKAWTGIGYKQLMQGSPDADGPAPFSRAAFGPLWDTVRYEMAHHAPSPDCDIVLGLTTTKHHPHVISYVQGVEAPVMRFAGVFRVVGDANALAFAEPTGRHVLPGRYLNDILILDPIDSSITDSTPRQFPNGEYRLPLSSVRQLVEASGAFPAAFAPREVSFRFLDTTLKWTPDGTGFPCLRASVIAPQCLPPLQAHFVDGGLFDNRPLGLALDLARTLEWPNLSRQDSILARDRRAATDSLMACVPRVVQRMGKSTTQLSALADSAQSLSDSLRRIEQRIAAFTTDSTLTDSVRVIEEQRKNVTNLLAAVDSRLHTASLLADSAATRTECGPAEQRLARADSSLDTFRSYRRPRILYFIDDDARRRPLGSARPQSDDEDGDDATAGLAAAAQAVWRVFDTGQNQEMRRFLADLQNHTDENVALGVNSRYPNLLAENMEHFGAFLSRTFREHDFYDGVYDGLRSTFRELYCRPPSKSGKIELQPVASGACDAKWTDIVLSNGMVRADPAGMAVMTFLLRSETSGSAKVFPANDHARVLLSLAQASTAMEGKTSPGCAKMSLAEKPLCSDGLDLVVKAWGDSLDAHGGASQLLQTEAGVRDTDATDLLGDSRAFYNSVLLDLLTHTRDAEARLDDEHKTGFPSLLGLPVYLQRAYIEQFRSCFQVRYHAVTCIDPNPTTSDVLPGWWRYHVFARGIPRNAMVKRDGSARWLEWQPTWYAARWGGYSWGVTTPVEAVRAERSGHGAIGAGLLIMPPNTVTSISVTQIGTSGSLPQTDITVSFLAGVARVGIRRNFGGADGFRRLSQSATFGIGDTNGISARVLKVSLGWLDDHLIHRR